MDHMEQKKKKIYITKERKKMSQFQEKKKRYDKITELQTLKQNIDLEQADKSRLQRQLSSLRDPLYESKQKVKKRMMNPVQKRTWSKSFQAKAADKDDYESSTIPNMKNVFNEMDTLIKTNKSKMIIDKLNSLTKNKNQLVEYKQIFSNKLDKLESTSDTTKLNEEVAALKQQLQRQSLKLNELADIELNIRDVRKTNQQKEKYLQQYERKIMNQQNRYNEFQNAIKNVSLKNGMQEERRTTVVRYSLYVAYICLLLMTILTILTITSDNRRTHLSGFKYVIDKVLFGILFVALISYLYHMNIKTHMMELNVITIIYTLILMLMISIHRNKNKEVFTEEDKKKFTIALSIKLGLLCLLFVYLLISNKTYKYYSVGSIGLQVKSKVRTELTKSIAMMITTVIGIVTANTLQYLR